jgi:hypothetical protein
MKRQDSAGMRLVTWIVRHAGQHTHKNQYWAAMAAPIVGENSIGNDGKRLRRRS